MHKKKRGGGKLRLLRGRKAQVAELEKLSGCDRKTIRTSAMLILTGLNEDEFVEIFK